MLTPVLHQKPGSQGSPSKVLPTVSQYFPDPQAWHDPIELPWSWSRDIDEERSGGFINKMFCVVSVKKEGVLEYDSTTFNHIKKYERSVRKNSRYQGKCQ